RDACSKRISGSRHFRKRVSRPADLFEKSSDDSERNACEKPVWCVHRRNKCLQTEKYNQDRRRRNQQRCVPLRSHAKPPHVQKKTPQPAASVPRAVKQVSAPQSPEQHYRKHQDAPELWPRLPTQEFLAHPGEPAEPRNGERQRKIGRHHMPLHPT